MLKEQLNINDCYQLNEEQINFYRENEFIKLKNVFSKEEIAHYKDYIFNKTLELNTRTPDTMWDSRCWSALAKIGLRIHMAILPEFGTEESKFYCSSLTPI